MPSDRAEVLADLVNASRRLLEMPTSQYAQSVLRAALDAYEYETTGVRREDTPAEAVMREISDEVT